MAEKPETVVRDGKSWPVFSAAEMAALCGFGQEMLRKLERAGVFSKIGKDQYCPLDVFSGLLAYMRDEERRSSKSAGASAVQMARAEQIRLQTAREQGLLTEISRTEATFADVIGSLRSELDGVPAASTRDLTLREVIESHLNAAIERARARFDERVRELRKKK